LNRQDARDAKVGCMRERVRDRFEERNENEERALESQSKR
jgi:hypothetical protein